MGFKRNFLAVSSAAAIALAGAGLVAVSQADPPDKPKVPKYVPDGSWPKPMPVAGQFGTQLVISTATGKPKPWSTGEVAGTCVDSRDHVFIVTRGNLVNSPETLDSVPAPPVIEFDRDGKVVNAWGNRNVLPNGIHGCFIDYQDNIWIAGNGDGIVQKYTRDGSRLLLQIGTRGKFDSADGTRRGKGLNAARDQLHMPSGMVVDPGNGDIYVADGYGNRRIAVFDKDGKFLRQWGRQATDEETQAGAPGVFAEVVHCIAMSNAGLIYACDRQGNRVQVYQKDGTFVRNIPIPNATGKLPDKRGTAWWVAFSPDREQKFMYMMNGGTEQVHILDHASGKILSSFGRPGHQIGNFTHGHTIAVDSKGNIYVAETDWGRRVQKFKIVSGP